VFIVDVAHVPGKGSIAVVDGLGKRLYGPSTLTDCHRWRSNQVELRKAQRNNETSALRRAFG
jgi:hypothetical protein